MTSLADVAVRLDAALADVRRATTRVPAGGSEEMTDGGRPGGPCSAFG